MNKTEFTHTPPWFEDPRVLEGMPFLLSCLAWYNRRFHSQTTGITPGGSFLHRLIIKLLKASGHNGKALLKLSGLKVWIDIFDARLFPTMYEMRAATAESDFLRAVLHKGDTFIDVGANHGSFALLGALLVGHLGRVIAFEPQVRLAKMLQSSFDANSYAHATAFPFACSYESGEAEFYRPLGDSGSAGLFAQYSGDRPHSIERVTMVRLDDVLKRETLPGKVVVKLDVEGSELDALRGAARLIGTHRPLLLFELNPTSAAASGSSVSALLNYLYKCGYGRCSEIDRYPNGRPTLEVALTPQRNLIAIPNLEK